MKNVPFSVRLRLRGLTQEALAKQIGSGRAHVCQVLNNVPGRGRETRKKLAPLLTEDERRLLGWDSDGNVFHAEQKVPPL